MDGEVSSHSWLGFEFGFTGFFFSVTSSLHGLRSRIPQIPQVASFSSKMYWINRLRLGPARLRAQSSLGYLTFYFYKRAARPWNELHGDGHPMIRPPTTTAQRYPYYKSVASRKEVSA